MGLEEGLANPLVNCLAQSGDGLVWAGTWSGLFRTDGTRFELVDPAPGGTVLDLAVDGKGDLWVASDHALALRHRAHFQTLGPAQGLPEGGAYRRVLACPEGIFVICENRGYRSADGSRFEPIPGLGETPLLDLLWAPARGGTWALSAHGIRRILDERDMSLPRLQPGDSLLQAAEDAEGYFWLLSQRGLWRQAPGSTVWVDQRARFTFGLPTRLNAGVGGGIVLHAHAHAWWVKGEVLESHTLQVFQAAPGVGAALMDREGVLWLGAYSVQRTLGEGLWRIFDEREGLPAPGAWGMIRDRRGRLWVGGGKGLCLGVPGGWKVLLPGRQILSVQEDPEGGIWATGDPRDCVHRVDPESLAVETFRLPTPEPAQFRGVIPGRTAREAWVFPRWPVPGWAYYGHAEGRDWRWSPVLLGGSPITAVSYMRKAPDGRVYLTAPGGLYRLEGAQARLVLSRPAEWSPQYLTFSRDGELFLGNNDSHDILRFKPAGDGFSPSGRVTLPPSLGPYLLFAMEVDGTGHLWAGTSEGVMRMELGTGQTTRWTKGEGLPSNDCNALAILPEPNGDTWVGTAGGLALFQGSRERPVSALPAPLITSIRLQGRSLAAEEGTLELPSRPGTLEFRFQCLHFGLQARIRHQVRILGLNSAWESLDESRLALRGLGPGTYQLEVRSVLPEGLQSPVTSLAFRVAPAWWQTLWARAAAWLGLLALAATAIRIWVAQLRQRNRMLERMVAERGDEVARIGTQLLLAKEQADLANRSKSGFLANMSHELRTPLSAILLYTELLQESAREAGQAKAVRDLGRVAAAGKHLLTLINDLLDLARIEAGRARVQIECIALEPFLAEIHSTLKPLVDARGNQLQLQVERAPESLEADPTKLRQILFNLLSNANKFTKDGRLSLEVSEAEQGIVFEVTDTGIGMTPAQLGRIFQKFVQADDSIERQYGGTGLGLVISVELTKLLGGTLTVSSEIGQGTAFRLTIPKVHVPVAEPAEFSALEGDRPKAVVLESDTLHRDFLARMLGREGYWVGTAKGWDEGIRLVQQIHPAVVIVGLRLAQDEGGPRLRQLQQEAKCGHPSVLLAHLNEDGTKGLVIPLPQLLTAPFETTLASHFEARGGEALLLTRDPELRRTLSILAHAKGWGLETFEETRAAMESLRATAKDLLLVDLSDASESIHLLDQIHRLPELSMLPLVALLPAPDSGLSGLPQARQLHRREDLQALAAHLLPTL
ncbi:ATP-binding protein [Geothrix limicola]|nr:ATP-binding protein [Geothrix limicola]